MTISKKEIHSSMKVGETDEILVVLPDANKENSGSQKTFLKEKSLKEKKIVTATIKCCNWGCFLNWLCCVSQNKLWMKTENKDYLIGEKEENQGDENKNKGGESKNQYNKQFFYPDHPFYNPDHCGCT